MTHWCVWKAVESVASPSLLPTRLEPSRFIMMISPYRAFSCLKCESKAGADSSGPLDILIL